MTLSKKIPFQSIVCNTYNQYEYHGIVFRMRCYNYLAEAIDLIYRKCLSKSYGKTSFPFQINTYYILEIRLRKHSLHLLQESLTQNHTSN
jgi:hypothetical protein